MGLSLTSSVMLSPLHAKAMGGRSYTPKSQRIVQPCPPEQKTVTDGTGFRFTTTLNKIQSKIVEEMTPQNIPGLRDLDQVREFIAQKHDGQKAQSEYLRAFDSVRGKIEFAALAFRLPPAMLACLIYQESKFDPKVISSKGAEGMLQLTGMGKAEVLRILTEGAKEKAPPVHARVHSDWRDFVRLNQSWKDPSDKQLSTLKNASRLVKNVDGGSVLLSSYLDQIRASDQALTRFDLLNGIGAYNMGLPAALKTCGKRRGKKCTEALVRSNPETRAQITMTDECMSRYSPALKIK